MDEEKKEEIVPEDNGPAFLVRGKDDDGMDFYNKLTERLREDHIGLTDPVTEYYAHNVGEPQQMTEERINAQLRLAEPYVGGVTPLVIKYCIYFGFLTHRQKIHENKIQMTYY